MIRNASLLLAGTIIGATAAITVSQVPSLVPGVAYAAASDTYRQLNLFGDVFERIRADYVEKPDDSALIEAAVNGMLTSLDPHSSYMNPKDFKDMQVQTRGEFGGLGIEVTMEDGVVKVVSPIDDTPAAKAGIQAGDLIVAIDGEPVQNLTLNQAVEKMRGAVNTPITLQIERKGTAKPFDVKVVRDVIRIQSVKSRAEGDVGYIRISSFNEQTFDGLKAAIAKLDKEIGADKIKGYILDLRNNPGGLLDQAVAVGDAFLDQGEIVATRGRHSDQNARYDARDGDLTDRKPVIVLINGGSASASEIVAGALQDQKRATILGTRSFGKGSVQTIIPLGSNGAIRLTTARYYTPAGRSIQAKGIDPDIEVVQDLPPELKDQVTSTQGEASLKGHLTNEAGGDEGVGHLEGAGERQFDHHRLAEHVEFQHLAKPVGNGGEKADRRSRRARRDNRLAAIAGDGGDAGGIGAVGVDHRRRALGQELGEQPHLGGEIVLDHRMVVHVIAAEIGEGRRLQAHAVEAMLVEPVARRLQRGMGDAVEDEVVQRRMQLDRIGRGQAAIDRAMRADDTDRSDRGGGMAGGGEDLPGENGDGGLAGRAGHRDELFRLQRIEARGKKGERRARLLGPEHWHAGIGFERGIRRAEHRRGTARDGVADEAEAVAGDAAQRREEIARFHRPAVGGHAPDRHVREFRADRMIGPGKEAERHGRARSHGWSVPRGRWSRKGGSICAQYDTSMASGWPSCSVLGWTPRKAAERRITLPAT